MTRLYRLEYLNDEHSSLPMTFFVESLIEDSPANSLIPFDTSLRTMLDEIMMWCVTEHLPEDLVRFLLGLLPDFNFKVITYKFLINIIYVIFSFYLQKHFYVSMVL
jgi:hypothetical protein